MPSIISKLFDFSLLIIFNRYDRCCSQRNMTLMAKTKTKVFIPSF